MRHGNLLRYRAEPVRLQTQSASARTGPHVLRYTPWWEDTLWVPTGIGGRGLQEASKHVSAAAAGRAVWPGFYLDSVSEAAVVDAAEDVVGHVGEERAQLHVVLPCDMLYYDATRCAALQHDATC